MTAPPIDPTDMRETANLIWGALDRVAREQSLESAIVAAIKNLHGNVAYLRDTLGEIETIELLGELRETMLSSAFARMRKESAR